MKFHLYQPQAIHELGGRDNQEDSIFPLSGQASTTDRIFVVCDGMGGHENGEVASQAVSQRMGTAAVEQMSSTGQLTDQQFDIVLRKAFDALDDADVKKEGKMGTTMTFLAFHKGGCLVAHIGDSRIYHLRPATGEVLYRSRDHSLVQQLYELGEISYNEMGTSPRKNIILKAMQPYQDERAKASIVHITDIKKGDYFYLCTDGMLEQMEDDELMSILRGKTTDEEKAAKLVQATRGNADNHSAYLIRIADVEHEAGDELLPDDEKSPKAMNKALTDRHKSIAWFEKPNAAPSPTPLKSASQAKPDPKRWILSLVLMGIAVIIIVLLLVKCLGHSNKSEEPELNEERIYDNAGSSDKDKAATEMTTPEKNSEPVVGSAPAPRGDMPNTKPDNMPTSEPGTAEPAAEPDNDESTNEEGGLLDFVKDAVTGPSENDGNVIREAVDAAGESGGAKPAIQGSKK